MNTDQPNPEVKAVEPKSETATPKPDPKAIELTHDAKAAKSVPEIKAQAKSEVKPRPNLMPKPSHPRRKLETRSFLPSPSSAF